MRDDIPADSQCLINPANLTRAANRNRQKHRPADPSEIDFELDFDHVPEDGNFLQRDIRTDTARHLIFATAEQLRLLRSVQQVFMDGTFRVVKQPFMQLFSFHGFLLDDEDQEVKQVPLAFALMSRRRKSDYVAVFNAVKELAPNLANKDMDMVTDFEAAIWTAAEEVFPDASMHGCSFHWCQAVMRAVGEKSLAQAYRTNHNVRTYIWKLFALPYLPLGEIEGAFYRLASSATAELRPLVDYIEETWINDHQSYSKPASWCVYRRAIRTNIDVEGWHRRLNKHAGRGKLPLYTLLGLLYKEAELIPYQGWLVSEKQLRRCRRQKSTETQALLGQLWEDYQRQELSVKQLLQRVSLLHAVVPVLHSLPPSVPRLPSVDNVVWV